MDLCCPECEHDTFEQTRTTQTQYTMKFDARSQSWYETAEEVTDGGDLGDHDIVCADCGYEVCSDSDLVVEIID